MKKTILFLAALIIFTTSFSQIQKYRATDFICILYHGSPTNNDFVKCNSLFVFDIPNKKITKYGVDGKPDIYDVIRFDEKLTEPDGSQTAGALCVDNDGIRCYVYLTRDTEYTCFTIEYSNNRYAYILEKEN